MMAGKRRVFGAAFKAKVALAAAKGDRTTAQLASQFGIHTSQVTAWKKQLMAQVAELFADGRQRRAEQATDEQELYEQIGRLKMEVEWLKKKAAEVGAEVKRLCIEPNHKHLSIARQCQLVGLARSSWYYEPLGESAENLALMREIDRLYIKLPFFGTRKVRKRFGINRKRAQRLMRLLGLEAVCPKRSTSRPAPGHKVYPYLLRNMAITKPDQVWASDITYIPLQHGFLYLTAVMDLYSRNVLSWRLSNTLTGDFCLDALDAALLRARPEIFNTDQGAQFTATAFTSRLKKRGVAISMDGRGRALDNVFVERLWRTVKYEEVYLRDYADGWQAKKSLGRYFNFYRNERPHQALGYRTPSEVYAER
ncbi:MAG: IS3 family transposase [Planctomycetia bacterium]|nr:IS3 family transposase [Planctomycetia bacterium]